MLDKYFYITTTLPYVNASPHIGFALEIVAADVITRYQRLLGKEVIFNTGTDEHGQKIYEKAQEANQDVQKYVNAYAAKFEELKELLDLSYTHFIRTTNPDHIAAAQAFWLKCQENGDIYKRMYKTSYCVGCELEKQASDLENGCCPLHPDQEIEIREEENYFFKFSNYQDALLNLYENTPNFVQPEGKLAEIKAFASAGLKDFSISRLKEKMSWGVPVPGDDDHVMYVWFDALVNYVSTLGWPDDQENMAAFWPGVQVAGKDNLRQQSAMWQAMLISAGLAPSEKILINGFINVGGQKMSKSLGNVIAPSEMVEKYGREASRYLLINLGPFGEDMDVTWEKLDTTYTADLSNGLGNLCSRVATLCEKTGFKYTGPEYDGLITHVSFQNETNENMTVATIFHEQMSSYDLGTALKSIFTEAPVEGEYLAETGMNVAEMDKYLADEEPWKMEPEAAHVVLETVVADLLLLSLKLQPFMPETAEQIRSHFLAEEITSMKPMFPRLR